MSGDNQINELIKTELKKCELHINHIKKENTNFNKLPAFKKEKAKLEALQRLFKSGITL